MTYQTDDQPFSLIDVENGMFNLSLHTILTPPCFTFFWGLIQTANRLKPRFKNPFSMTVAQAIAAGGGNSRQSIHQKQQQLNQARIDGKHLIQIRPGSRSKYVCASYTINYNLLIPQSVMIPEFHADTSNIIDATVDTTVDTGVDTVMTFLRSEENRTTEDVVVFDQRSIAKDISRLQGTILNKWPHKLVNAPSDSDCRQALESFDIDQLLEALERAPTIPNPPNGRQITPGYLLGVVLKYAENTNWGKPKEEYVNNKDTDFSYLYRDYEAREIKCLNDIYNNYKDGKRPPRDFLTEQMIPIKLRDTLPSVEKHINQLPFSVDDFKAVMKKWGVES